MQPVYLTFDDGPVPGVTDRVLDILARYGQRATFFCVGANLERHPQLSQQALAQGHALANHTYHHADGWRTPTADYLAQIARTHALLTQLGATSRRFRPPYGRITPAQAWALRTSHRLTLWHALAWDWDAHLTPQQCLDRLHCGLAPGRIAVLHDSRKAAHRVLGLLPPLLDTFQRRGWQSVPLVG